MRAAAAALVGAALFLGGVLVGAAGTAGGSSPLPAPVELVNDASAGSGTDEVQGVNEGPVAVEEVEHEVEGHGLEYYEDSGPGGGSDDATESEREDEELAEPSEEPTPEDAPSDDPTPEDDNSGSGSDNSGSGSDSSGSGSGSSGSGSGSSG